MRPYINYNFIKYFNNCDLIYKYSLKSIYLIPECNKIQFNIFFKESNLSSNSEISKTQINSILFLYLYSTNNIHINTNYIQSISKNSLSADILLFVSITKKKIFKYFFNLFLILNKLTQPFSISESKNYFSLKNKLKDQYLTLNFKLPVFHFIGNRESENFNFNLPKIKTNIELKRVLYTAQGSINWGFKKNLVKFLQNNFLFWVLK